MPVSHLIDKSYIMYRVGRKPYIVERFEETAEGCKITVPFLIGDGYTKSGHHLLMQTMREGGVVEVVLSADDQINAVATLPSDRVSRYTVRSKNDDKANDVLATRIAKWYDFRVSLGDFEYFCTKIKLKFESNGKQVIVWGQAEQAVLADINDVDTEGMTATEMLDDMPRTFSIEQYVQQDQDKGRWVSLLRGWELKECEWNGPIEQTWNWEGHCLSSAPKFYGRKRRFTALFEKA